MFRGWDKDRLGRATLVVFGVGLLLFGASRWLEQGLSYKNWFRQLVFNPIVLIGGMLELWIGVFPPRHLEGARLVSTGSCMGHSARGSSPSYEEGWGRNPGSRI